ncbi:hypothetical protein ROHU_020237 [Labeo rohita]|uniref:Uncharacterized protein n=1 Tax=Labeo rohita TaxID=84645 RepID=A0A498N9C0_LABRO|nr:hypothetical protein ROHU_020237 [Labeo rohita]
MTAICFDLGAAAIAYVMGRHSDVWNVRQNLYYDYDVYSEAYGMICGCYYPARVWRERKNKDSKREKERGGKFPSYSLSNHLRQFDQNDRFGQMPYQTLLKTKALQTHEKPGADEMGRKNSITPEMNFIAGNRRRNQTACREYRAVNEQKAETIAPADECQYVYDSREMREDESRRSGARQQRAGKMEE